LALALSGRRKTVVRKEIHNNKEKAETKKKPVKKTKAKRKK
jgi:hypothetical protein